MNKENISYGSKLLLIPFFCIKIINKKIIDIDLKYLIDSGIIDILNIQSIIEMKKKQELLNNHPYKIWCGSNGKWYTYLPDEEKGRILKKRNTKKDIEDVVIFYWNETTNSPTIEEVFNEWNDYRLELKKISKSSHTRLQQVFKRHYSEFGKKRIKNITENEFIEFLERQIPEHSLSAKAFASLKTITKGILKRAKRKELISYNAEDVLSQLDISNNEFNKIIKEDYEEVFNEQETQITIKYLKDNLDIRNSAILLMFITGTRIGEIVALKPEDINIEKNTIKIKRTETRYKENNKTIYEVKLFPKTQSGNREIVVPSSYQWLLRNLKAYSENKEWVFMEKNKRLTTLLIRKRVYKMCKDTNIYKKSPHKIRATYDTILLDANLDKRFIKDQMGHSDITTSEKYYHRNRKSLEKKSEIINSISEFTLV